MLRFKLDNFNSRTVCGWFHAGPHSARTNARNHALAFGAAGMWFANDSYRLIYVDSGGKVRQRTWPHAAPS